MPNTSHRHVIPETFVQLLYEYLDSKGHEPESLLGHPWPQNSHDGLGGINVELWSQFLNKSAVALNDPVLGLDLARTVSVKHLGLVGALTLASENMQAAFQRLDRYLRLVFDVVPMVIRHGEDWFEITWDESDYQTDPLVNVTGNAVMVQFCRSLVRGGVADPIHVQFRHIDSEHVKAYESFFNCPVRFGGSEVVIRYSTDFLLQPLKTHDPSLITLLEQHADRLLDKLPQQGETVAMVRKMIASVLRDGEPDINAVIGKLGMSRRTLQRRLSESGTSFREQLILVRKELAEAYLADRRLQIVDVALLLGYSEHSAFTRVYREWTGSSPREARLAMRSE